MMVKQCVIARSKGKKSWRIISCTTKAQAQKDARRVRSNRPDAVVKIVSESSLFKKYPVDI